MLPHNHIHGQNCPICAEIDRRNRKKIGTNEFIENAKKYMEIIMIILK